MKAWLTFWTVLTDKKSIKQPSPWRAWGALIYSCQMTTNYTPTEPLAMKNNIIQRLKPLRSVSFNEQKLENADIKQEIAG